MSDPTAPTTISLRAPSKYATPSKPEANAFVTTPSAWLLGTWAVTHSTFPMWKSAKNVRISYEPNGSASDGSTVSTVAYEKKGGKAGGAKSIVGVERPDPAVPSAWNWRGKGLLMIASSHWEILGWGEQPRTGGADSTGSTTERWAVTWFAPTIFSPEGVDIYCDQKGGLSKETVDEIMKALKEVAAPKVVQMVEKDMQEVEISLPWQEKK